MKGLPDLEKLFTENKYETIAPITTADIAVINEVDKASSNIRNSLLGVMNEKFLFNGKVFGSVIEINLTLSQGDDIWQKFKDHFGPHKYQIKEI